MLTTWAMAGPPGDRTESCVTRIDVHGIHRPRAGDVSAPAVQKVMRAKTTRRVPVPTLGPHGASAVLRALRGRAAALCGPRIHQEARGPVGQAGDGQLRLARGP